MIIQIDLSKPKATYVQIVDCVRRAIATGALRPGDQLPTIRDVAIKARVNRNTVSRAYLELEHMGLVLARQGSGCYVSDSGPKLERAERKKLLERMTEDLALEAVHFQIPIEDVIEMLRRNAAKFGKESKA